MPTPNPPNDALRINLPFGSKVVTLIEIRAESGRAYHPIGSVGVVVKTINEAESQYRIRFSDASEENLPANQIVLLAKFKKGDLALEQESQRDSLFDSVHYRCIIGSRAYGLDDEHSDVDYRGFYLPPAEMHWSLYGVPEQLECHETQEAYWELQKYITLALKANPNVLESLYTPLVEKATPLAEELLSIRSIFLSQLIYQTFNGYAMSQFKKMQSDLRNQGEVKWKHAMHLIRLLITGIVALREGTIPVHVHDHREELLAIKRGERTWMELDKMRMKLHEEFEVAFENTQLPERPDYEQANDFLVQARRWAFETGGI